MGYYIRVLGIRDVPLSIETLRACLSEKPAVEINEGRSDRSGWSQLTWRHIDGTEIAIVEKNPVLPGELGAEELSEFIDEVQDAQPASASNVILQRGTIRWRDGVQPRYHQYVVRA